MSKLTDTQWAELTREVVQICQNDQIRLGQAYMNALWKVDENLYNQITEEQKADPFYQDEKLPDFINFLAE